MAFGLTFERTVSSVAAAASFLDGSRKALESKWQFSLERFIAIASRVPCTVLCFMLCDRQRVLLEQHWDANFSTL